MTTTAAHESNPRRSPRAGRQVVAAGLAAALLASACAQEADGPDVAVGDVGEFAATAEYLAGVAEATDGLSYRMSMDMSMTFAGGGQIIDMGGRFMTGDVDGDMSSMTMDLGALMEGMADQMPAGEPTPEDLFGDDMTMEMVTDGDTLYMRAPYFASMADVMTGMGATDAELGPLGDLAELGDRWGSIDLSEISLGEITNAAGARSADPRAYLDVVAAGADVTDLGADTIDGVEVRGLGATVTYGDMLEAQGMNPDDFAETLANGMSAQGADAGGIAGPMMEQMLAMDIPIEAWIDGDDLVRRIALELDMTSIMESAAEAAGEDANAIGEITMSTTMTMDFSDYGDESIEIDIPADAIDITDEYRALIEGGGVGAGSSSLGTT